MNLTSSLFFVIILFSSLILISSRDVTLSPGLVNRERCRYNYFSARQLIQCLPGYILGVLRVLALTTISLLDIIKFFSNLELNRCKKYRDTSVQLTTTSTCPCTTTTLSFRSKSQFAMTLMVSIYNYGATIQSCSGTWVWLIIIHVHSCRYASCRETLIRRR